MDKMNEITLEELEKVVGGLVTVDEATAIKVTEGLKAGGYPRKYAGIFLANHCTGVDFEAILDIVYGKEDDD